MTAAYPMTVPPSHASVREAPSGFSAHRCTVPGALTSSLKKVDSPFGIRARKASTASVSSVANRRVSTSDHLFRVRFHPVAERRERLALGAAAYEQADVSRRDSQLGP